MNDTDRDEKKARQIQMARQVWLFLTPIFAILVLFMLYSWSQGHGGLTSVFSPLAMMCIGLSTIFSTKNKTLQYIFLALGVILVVAGLVFLIIY